jgi:hypothetical protein
MMSGDIDMTGGVGQRVGRRGVIDRLGDDKARAGIDLARQALGGVLQAVGFRMGIEDHADMQAGIVGHGHQIEEIDVPDIRCRRAIAQGDKIAGGDQDRFDPQGPGAPQKALQAQAVVIPGGAVENGGATGAALEQSA